MAKELPLGYKIGKLTVIGLSVEHISWCFSKRLKRKAKYISYKQRCHCECGNEIDVFVGNLLKGNTKSCGCIRSIQARINGARSAGGAPKDRPDRLASRRVGGLSKTSEYKIWLGMRRRCSNPKDSAYERYGGRGITVCDEWMTSFKPFYEHIGQRPTPKHSVDRIDNNLGYMPGNVRWATAKEQQQNTRPRNEFMMTIDGETKTVREWSAISGVKRTTLLYRFKKGVVPPLLFSLSKITISDPD